MEPNRRRVILPSLSNLPAPVQTAHVAVQPISAKSQVGTPVELQGNGTASIFVRQVEDWSSYITAHLKPSVAGVDNAEAQNPEEHPMEERFASNLNIWDYGRLLVDKEVGGMVYPRHKQEYTHFGICSAHRPWNPYFRNLMCHKMALSRTVNYGFGTGSSYNVKYSPNGSILLAAYENGYIDILHNSNERLTRIRRAHSDSVNGFCWLDDHRFISYSDDCSIASWDIRLCAKPMQVIHGDDLTPSSFLGNPTDPEMSPWIKDAHLVPKDRSGNGKRMLYVSAFSRFIYRIDLDDSDLMTPLAPLSLIHPLVRTAYLPATSPFDGNLVAAYLHLHSMQSCYIKELLKGKEGSLYLPQSIHVGASYSLLGEEGQHGNAPAVRSIKPDPLGRGIIVRKYVISSRGNDYSYTAYYKLESHPDLRPEIPDKIVMEYFIRDKVSEDYFQEPAFAPNGCFLACPQVEKVSILTSGPAAVPFTYAQKETASAVQFHLATLIELPKCSNILCCDVSPADNLTVACGCTMGHVHFLQPRF